MRRPETSFKALDYRRPIVLPPSLETSFSDYSIEFLEDVHGLAKGYVVDDKDLVDEFRREEEDGTWLSEVGEREGEFCGFVFE